MIDERSIKNWNNLKKPIVVLGKTYDSQCELAKELNINNGYISIWKQKGILEEKVMEIKNNIES